MLASSFFIYTLVVTVLAFLLLLLNLILAPHNPYEAKVSSYECGMTVIHGQTRIPFNIQFYLIAILFLIFDLEIFYLVPLTVSMYYIGVYGFIIFLLFFIILTIGFVFEIGSGAISISPSINK